MFTWDPRSAGQLIAPPLGSFGGSLTGGASRLAAEPFCAAAVLGTATVHARTSHHRRSAVRALDMSGSGADGSVPAGPSKVIHAWADASQQREVDEVRGGCQLVRYRNPQREELC